MRRSILLALVTALALMGIVGATASLAAGPGAGAQVAARGGRRAARCARGRRARRGRCRRARTPARRGTGVLVDGTYKDASTSVLFIVAGGEGEVSFPMPNDGGCPGGGLLVTGRGPLSTAAGTVRSSGSMQGSLFPSIDWAIAIRSATLTYQLDVRFVLQFPGDPPCTGSGAFSGTLAKK